MSISSRHLVLPLLLSTLLGAVGSSPVRGQVVDLPPVDEETGPPPGPVLFWASYGAALPFVVGGEPEGDAVFVQLGLERDGRTILLRAARIGDAYGPGSDPIEEYGILFGLTRQVGVLHLLGAIGIGRVTGFECVESDDPEECDEAGTFGFPLVLEATLDPLPYLGIGVQGYANLNPDASFGGIGLVGRIGRLR